jgi:putative heme transporter
VGEDAPPARERGKLSTMKVSRQLRRIVTVLLLFLVVEYLVLPQIAGVRKALDLLGGARPWLLALGVAAEAAALLAYAQLTRAVLPKGGRLGLWTSFRVDLATLAASHVVPGGSAVGAGLGFRLLTEAGVDGASAGFALGAQSIGSAIVLNVVLWLALVGSIPFHGFNPLYVTAAVGGAVLIGLFSALVLLLTRGEARAARAFRWIARHVPFLDEDDVHRLVHTLAGRIRELTADPGLLWRAIGWAAANWVLDAASLWLFVAAFGVRVQPDSLLVSYGLANVLAAIPITPGGLGVVEAILTSTLVGFGVPRGVAILGVIGYRLVNFWLPIPIGGLAFLSLRVDRGARRGAKARALRTAAERTVRERESARDWAERHGIKLPAAGDDPPGGDGAAG